MTKREKMGLCHGCRNDFYNGKNDLGVKECWNLETATSVRRTMVGIWQNPPYKWDAQQTLSCHMPDGGTTWIKREDVRLIENGAQPWGTSALPAECPTPDQQKADGA